MRPPQLKDLKAGTQLIAGLGKSMILADLDFETYSPAGFVWREDKQKFVTLPNATKKGLAAVGVAKYVEHPEAEVLSLAYDLKDGLGARLWVPGQLPPLDLFLHIRNHQLLEAWNCSFERWVWNKICVPKYGFPPLPTYLLRDAMAKSRAFGLPGGLEAAGDVLNISAKKDKDGKRLLNKFSIPRDPTAKDRRTRIKPTHEDQAEDAQLLYNYNIRDIEAEAEISSRIPDLNPTELEFWKVDQLINSRGVRIDTKGVNNCIKILQQAYLRYNTFLPGLTGGAVTSATQIQKISKWLLEQGIEVKTLGSTAVDELLARDDLSDTVRRVLEIRSLIGSAAVKKVYAMKNQITNEERLHDLFIYHSARTGRAAGAGAQPQNLPNSGAEISRCIDGACGRTFAKASPSCPWCGTFCNEISRCTNAKCDKSYPTAVQNCPFCNCPNAKNVIEWCPKAVEDAFETINSGSLDCVEYFWDNAIATVSGCLRGLFISSPSHDLLCSDYSAIEAVVLAALAGEEWRLEVFKTHGKIYEMSASKITGIEFDEFLLYKATSGQHHPMRKKIGKVAELASGYGGYIGAWKQFGADKFFSDDEIKKAGLASRHASTAIVEMWGGQQKRWQPCIYGLEGMAISAVLSPGQTFSYRSISYLVRGDVLYCTLPSGRHICYHRPRLSPSDRRPGTYSLSFEGWNTNQKYGAPGWVRLETYGGKLTENVVQAVSRDILAHAIVNLEKSGFHVVLHVHDEIVCEVPEGFGSVEDLERIMCELPAWAQGWPIKASGGWRAKRYTK